MLRRLLTVQVGNRGGARTHQASVENRTARTALHSRSCWWSASESHRSGYLLARQIRVPSPHPVNSELLTATTRLIPHSLAASISNLHGLVPPQGLEPRSRSLRGWTLAC